jgi:hypothetical protein
MKGQISEKLSRILRSATGRAELREQLRNGRDGVINADGKVYVLRSMQYVVAGRVPAKG